MIGIVGGSFAGLFAARALARKGWPVTVFEPDEPGDVEDVDGTFDGWNRPGVPQLRQPHTIRALARKLLLERDPEMAADLLGCGAIEWSYCLRRPGIERIEDPDLIGVMARRTTFEPVVRARVEKTPGVRFVKASVEGLLLNRDPAPRATGIRLRDGSERSFDCIIDASGRRTRLPEWLRRAGVEPPAHQSQSAGMIYYSRYFRFHPGAQAVNLTGIRSGPAGVMPLMAFRSNMLDRATFSLMLAVASWEPRFRVLKRDAVFNAYANRIPAVATWIDPLVSLPISKVRAFGDIYNTYWDFLRDGRPIVSNLYSLGDARVHTSPYFGWGITLALKQAYLLADTFAGPNNENRQIEFEKAAAAFCHPYYEGAALEDTARSALWQGESLREDDPYNLYLTVLTPAASRDPYVYREVYRRTNMLSHPDAIFLRSDIIDRARQAMRSGPDKTISPGNVLANLAEAEKSALQPAQ